MVYFGSRGIIGSSHPNRPWWQWLSPRVDSSPSQKPSGFGGFGVDVSDEALEAEFSAVDKDGSGTISASEMKQALSSAFSKGGKPLSDKLVNEIMAEADSNGDGDVDLEEFKAIMRAGPGKIKQALQEAAEEAAKERVKEKAEREARAAREAELAAREAARDAARREQMSSTEKRHADEQERVQNVQQAAHAKAKQEALEAAMRWITHESGRVSPTKPVRPSELAMFAEFTCQALRECILSASRAAAYAASNAHAGGHR